MEGSCDAPAPAADSAKCIVFTSILQAASAACLKGALDGGIAEKCLKGMLRQVSYPFPSMELWWASHSIDSCYLCSHLAELGCTLDASLWSGFLHHSWKGKGKEGFITMFHIDFGHWSWQGALNRNFQPIYLLVAALLQLCGHAAGYLRGVT